MKNQKLSEQTWFVVLMIWLFFPVGLFFMWKNRKFHIVVRGLITAAYSLAILSTIIAAFQSIVPSSPKASTETYSSNTTTNDSLLDDSYTDTTSNSVSNSTPASDVVKETDKTSGIEPVTIQESGVVATSSETYETDLTAGNYTVGIDIPAGTYTLTAKNGLGTVYNSNAYGDGINEVMGTTEGGSSIKELNNVNFESGDVLTLSSTLVLHITSSSADITSIKARENTLTQSFNVQAGNYVAGTDFPAGVYDVIATGAAGNVSSSNMFDGGLNETMSSSNDGYSIQEFKHANLTEGSTLTISSTSVQLIPSK